MSEPMHEDPWYGLGLRERPGRWRRTCIFQCVSPCAEGCAPAQHLGRGPTMLFASQTDQRFSYCLYVPRNYAEDETTVYPLLVVVHGTERQPQLYRDAFAKFAEREQCIVLAPLFPNNIVEPGFELHNYKFIEFHGLRFDEILLGMVDEIAGYYRIDRSRFLLFGFSGGGQFVHRFAYLHPTRLLGVSIGAPGWVTLLDPERDWWVGVRDIEQRFGRPLDLDALREVPVQFVIGKQDINPWDVVLPEGSRYAMPGANDAGNTRIERIDALRASFAAHGISSIRSLVPNAGHEGMKMVPVVQEFFTSLLSRYERTADMRIAIKEWK